MNNRREFVQWRPLTPVSRETDDLTHPRVQELNDLQTGHVTEIAPEYRKNHAYSIQHKIGPFGRKKGRMREWVDICVRKCRWHAPRKHVISGNHCRKLTSGCHIKVSKRGGLSILSSHDDIATSEKQSEIGTAIFVCVCIHRTCPRDENDRAGQQLLIRR